MRACKQLQPAFAVIVGNDPFSNYEQLAQLEKDALKAGFEYIQELVFENGAIYKGYLKDNARHGPGI